jgi:hypothetical protein
LTPKDEDIDNKEKISEKRQESALLIDRYRFLDLFPCTKDELRSIGYKDSTLQTNELIVGFFYILFEMKNLGKTSFIGQKNIAQKNNFFKKYKIKKN